MWDMFGSYATTEPATIKPSIINSFQDYPKAVAILAKVGSTGLPMVA